MRLSVFLIAFVLSSASHALRGIVLDTAGHPLQDVEVRASWDNSRDTTDSFGMWSFDKGTGSVRKHGASWTWTRDVFQVRLDGETALRLDAIDAGGRTLWTTSVVGRAGWNRIVLPRNIGILATVLRLGSSRGGTILARRGGVAPDAPAARTTAESRAILFLRAGYASTLRLIDPGQDTVLTVLRPIPDTTSGKVTRVHVWPDTGVHMDLPQLSFSCETPGVTYFYTLDSSAPAWDTATLLPRTSATFAWTPANGPIVLNRSVWLRVAAGRHGMAPSDTFTGRYVHIGDTALVEDFEGTGLGSQYGVQGLSWFACRNMDGMGCTQDQAFELERTLPRLDTIAPIYVKALGKRAWKVQVSISRKGEDDHPGYAGGSVKIPPAYPDAAYRLVFRARWQDTWSGRAVPKVPLVVELALKGNAMNNGGYMDGMHRKVLQVDNSWKLFEIGFSDFHAAGNGYEPANSQPDSTSTDPKDPAVFMLDETMPALGLSGYQGRVTHNAFQPAWTWGISKDVALAKSDVVGVRFSVIQPMDSAAAASVGRGSDAGWAALHGSYAQWKDPREPAYTQAQLDALVKDIHGYLWIDDIRLVRKSL